MQLRITVVSFGFKYGVPVDADLLADMRFLPNPFWVPELRHRTGQDAAVATYVKDRADAQEFLERYVPVIETVGAGYLREGKRFMTVAIGCTGGKHRSVAMSEEIAARLRESGFEAEPPTATWVGSRRPDALVDRAVRGGAGWRARARRFPDGAAAADP